MRNIYFLLLVLSAFLFYPLTSVGKSTEDVSAVVSFLLNKSVSFPGYPKTLSGQPGEVETFVIPESLNISGEIQIEVNGETVAPIDWNEFDRELTIMIPYFQPKVYPLIISTSESSFPVISLTIEPLELPEGLTPEMVKEDTITSLNAVIDFGIELMKPGTTLRQENRQILDTLVGVFSSNFSQLSDKEKEELAALLHNGGVDSVSSSIDNINSEDQYNDLPNGPSNSVFDIRWCSKEVPALGCVDSDNLTPPRTLVNYDCGKDYTPWEDISSIIVLKKMTGLIKQLTRKYVKPITSLDGIIEDCKKVVIKESLKKAISAITSATSVFELVDAMAQATPIQLVDLNATIDRGHMYRHDEKLYSAEATFSPLIPSSTKGVISYLSGIVYDAIQEKIKDVKAKCGFAIVDSASALLDPALGALVENSEFHIDPKVGLESRETVDVPPRKLKVEISSNLIENEICRCKLTPSSSDRGALLRAKLSPSYNKRTSGIETVKVTFSYPDLNGVAITSIDYTSVKNRPPVVEPISTKPDVINEYLFLDHECDEISKFEIIGTPQFGTFDIDEPNGKFTYTQVDNNPTDHEKLEYRVFDGAEWSDKNTLTIVIKGCFSDNGDGTVSDSCTGLMWQRRDDGQWYSWYNAYAYCQHLSLGGYFNWRLPTKDELKSLVVCTNGTPTPLVDYPGHPYNCGDGNNTPYDKPTIDSHFSGQSWSYWSSDKHTVPTGAVHHWGVNFYYGSTRWGNEADYYVRCVR